MSSNIDITGLPTPAGSKLHNDSRPGTPSPIYMIIITTNTIIMIVHPPSNTKQATPRIRNFLDNKHIHDQSTLCRQILLLLSSQRRKTFSKLLPLAYRPRFFCISTQVFCTLPQVFVAYRLRLFCISPHQVFRLSSLFPRVTSLVANHLRFFVTTSPWPILGCILGQLNILVDFNATFRTSTQFQYSRLWQKCTNTSYHLNHHHPHTVRLQVSGSRSTPERTSSAKERYFLAWGGFRVTCKHRSY